ncbi:MAG: hypothetical protein RMM29_05185 [Planctomycetota bacterium]|nr:hypothetical protein [Planctomycetota bacterium]
MNGATLVMTSRRLDFSKAWLHRLPHRSPSFRVASAARARDIRCCASAVAAFFIDGSQSRETLKP